MYIWLLENHVKLVPLQQPAAASSSQPTITAKYVTLGLLLRHISTERLAISLHSDSPQSETSVFM